MSGAARAETAAPTRVVIVGYSGDAMEPFVTRDGRFLLFNNRNDPAEATDLRWARHEADGTWRYGGTIIGANSTVLTAVPSVDCANELYFVSPRTYDTTLKTIYRAHFHDGVATDVQPVEGLAAPRRGIVRFDAAISDDGNTLVFSEGTYGPLGGPSEAHLGQAHRRGDRFVVDDAAPQLFARVNAKGMNYGAELSSDGLTLYFTRVDPAQRPGAQIWRATRSSPTAAFDEPSRFEGLGDFVEAPALSPDETAMYYHRRDGDHYGLWKLELGGAGRSGTRCAKSRA